MYGPVEFSILTSWIREERVTAQTWIFVGESGSWHKAADISELQMLFGSKDPSSEVPSGSPVPATPLVQGIKPGMLRRVKILADMTDQQLGRFIQFMEVQKVRQCTKHS